MTTVLLCEGHELIRGGLKMILEGADMSVVGEAATGDEAVTLIQTLSPDVIVMDLKTPTMAGITAIRQIRADRPTAAILVVTEEDSLGVLRSAFEAGASGYLVKDSSPSELVFAVQTLAGGGRYVHPEVGAAMATRMATGSAPTTVVSGPGGALTRREVEVLSELASGMTNAEVADKLFLSVRTVENHRAHIFAKLGASTRAELVRRAIDAGLIGSRRDDAVAPIRA